jgi:hypothetical protein
VTRASCSPLRSLALVGALSLTLFSCDETREDADAAPLREDALPPALPNDAGGEATPSSAPDAALPQAIPLIDWVDLLVDKYGDESAQPDTVHDKNISDDERLGAYEKFFTPKSE